VPPTHLNPAIPLAVEEVILRGLQKDPEARFPTAEAMADGFNEALGRKLSTASYPILHVDSKPSLNVPQPSAKQNNRLYYGLGGALIVLLLLAVVVVLVLSQLQPQPPATAAATLAQATSALPKVIDNQIGVAADAVPASEELQSAQARLGSNGFIAYVTCNQTSQYHAAQAREMGDLAATYGLKFRIYDSNNEKYAEISQIERARADGVTGLIVCPLDLTTLGDTLKSVQDANLPLVMMASNTENYGGVLIGGDDHLMGLEAGRAAGHIIHDEMNGQANAIILDYPDLDFLVTRANGLEDGVLEIAPETKIIGRYLGATPENGQRSVERLLQDGTQFNVILSINDAGSYGAITAMEDASIDPSSVIISSVDAESIARQYIARGYFMRASVDVGRQKFSETAINAMVKLLAGTSVPETYLVPPGQVITQQTIQADATQPSP
jgi:ribose transport system substrate-binding protein